MYAHVQAALKCFREFYIRDYFTSYSTSPPLLEWKSNRSSRLHNTHFYLAKKHWRKLPGFYDEPFMRICIHKLLVFYTPSRKMIESSRSEYAHLQMEIKHCTIFQVYPTSHLGDLLTDRKNKTNLFVLPWKKETYLL
jgi:hypothetical protein